MGGIEISPKKTRKMKLSLALAAVAQANPTDWMVNQWWDQAVQVFNFSSNNWSSFAAAVDSVDDSQWQPLWQFCNADGSAALSYDEFRYTFGGFAATDAGVIMALFDGDSDGKLNAEELSEWKAKIQELMAQWGWNPTSDTKACLRNAWTAANKNGNVNDATRQEIALFTLGTWNCMLQ